MPFHKKDSLSFSTKNMLTYLADFNYIEKKYQINNPSLIEALKEYEKNQQYGKLQKLPPAYVGETIDRVYGFCAKQRMDSAKIFNRTFSIIINEFLNIKGLELLFDEHYYDFEWDMHLEYDTKTGKPLYYRDHMEHQIRNMYMMLTLLDDYGFIYEFKRLLTNRSTSKVSDYVYTRHKEFTETQHPSDKLEKILIQCAKSYYIKVFEDYLNSHHFKKLPKPINPDAFIESVIVFTDIWGMNIPKADFHESIIKDFDIITLNSNTTEELINKFKNWLEKTDTNTLIKSYFQDYSLGYIIRSAAIISALFHDLSYPLCFFLNIKNRIGEYLPSMNAFIHNIEADIDRIVSILNSSLLFVLVSEDEIRKKLAKNQKKYDHGVFSAISLLLYFYESGRIHQLSIDKQIAIELAALAIYNHNFDYNIVEESATEYYRPIFTQNPISYLLKICDEMQEWDRRYFELSKDDEHIFCPDCNSPIIKYRQYVNDEITESMICKCSKDKKKFYEKSIFFPCRNMYTVTTCRSIDIISKSNSLIFKLNYNLLDLLHMTQISCTYAAYRAKQLNKLKVLMGNQKYSDEDSKIKIKNLYLDYTMTCNPLYLKAKILLTSILNYGIPKKHESLHYIDFEKTVNQNLIRAVNKFSSNLNYNLPFSVLIDIDTKNWRNVWNIISKLTLKFFRKDALGKFRMSHNNILYLLNSQNVLSYISSVQMELKELLSSYISDAKISEEIFSSFEWKDLCNKIENSIHKKCYRITTDYIRKILREYIGKDTAEILSTKKLFFYFKLASCIFESYINSNVFPEDSIDFIKQIKKSVEMPYDINEIQFSEVVDGLLEDFHCIITNQVDVYGEEIDLEKYTKQFQSEDKVYQLIDKYINPVNWYDSTAESYNNFSENNLDFHSDLYLFELMGQAIKEKENEEEEPVKSTSKKTK